MSVDPLAMKHPEWSTYTYVADNPLILVDPDGRDWWKALGHALSVIANGKQILGGIAVSGLAAAGEVPSGGTSTFALAFGVENIGHGAVGLALNFWNGVIEATRSTIGDEKAFKKAPANGFFELVAKELGADNTKVNDAKLLDILNTAIGSGFDPRVLGSYVDVRKVIDLIGNAHTIEDVIKIIKEIQTQSTQKKKIEDEKKREEEQKKLNESQTN